MLASLVPTLEASSASVPSGIRRAASLYISARPRVPSSASPAACESASSEPPSCAPYQKRNPLNTDFDATRGANRADHMRALARYFCSPVRRAASHSIPTQKPPVQSPAGERVQVSSAGLP